MILLQKLNEPHPLESVRRDPPKTAFTSNTGVFVKPCLGEILSVSKITIELAFPAKLQYCSMNAYLQKFFLKAA